MASIEQNYMEPDMEPNMASNNVAQDNIEQDNIEKNNVNQDIEEPFDSKPNMVPDMKADMHPDEVNKILDSYKEPEVKNSYNYVLILVLLVTLAALGFVTYKYFPQIKVRVQGLFSKSSATAPGASVE